MEFQDGILMTHGSMRFVTVIHILILSVLFGCGQSKGTFSYPDHRITTQTKSAVAVHFDMTGGLNPSQVASSGSFQITGANYFGAVEPAKGTSTSFLVSVGSHVVP